MPGTSSAITIGSTPPTSATSGTGIWIDRTGLYSLSNGEYQVKIDAVDGRLYAGSGNIHFSSQGASFIIPSSYSRAASISFLNNTGTIVSQIFSTGTGTSTSFLRLISGGSEETFYTTDNGNIQFSARGNLTGNFEAEIVVPNNRLELKAYASSATRYITFSTAYLGERCDLTLWSDKISLGYGFYPTFDVVNGGYVIQSTAISCRVTRSTDQSISSGAWTAISFSSATWDDRPSSLSPQWSSGTPTRLTCRADGLYLITGHLSFAGNATGRRVARIFLNGSTEIALQSHPASSTNPVHLTFSVLRKLTAGNYIELGAFQDSGGALNVLTGTYTPVLSWTRIA